MNKEDLRVALLSIGENPAFYSLSGELIGDAIILFENYHKWEVFYMDERGGRNDKKEFASEDKACQYIYKMALSTKESKRGIEDT